MVIKAGAGVASDQEPVAMARQAADMAMGNARVVRADTAIVFATIYSAAEYTQILRSVAEVTGASRVIGSSACGILTQAEEQESGAGCAVLALASDNGEAPCSAHLCSTDRDGKAFFEPREVGPISSLVVFGDPAAFNPSPYEHIAGHLKIPVFGAGASGFREQLPGAPVFFGDQVLREASVALGLHSSLKPHIVVAYGCRALTAPLVVTKIRQNLVLELSGVSAMKILENELHAAMKNTGWRQNWEKPLPLLAGVLPDEDSPAGASPTPDDYYVRPILAVDSKTGGIVLDCGLREGSRITFVLREKDWAHKVLDNNLKTLAQDLRGKKPVFGLYFNCAGRGRELYGEDNHDLTLIQKHLGDFPLVGMFSSFELAPQGQTLAVHGFTGVLAVYTQS